MVKYKVLKRFNDLKKEKLRSPGDVVDYTIARATEIEDVIAAQGFEGPFLERIVDKKKEDKGE